MNASTLVNIDRLEFVELRDLPAGVTNNIQTQINKLRQEYQDLINCQVSIKAPISNPEGCYYLQILLTLSEPAISKNWMNYHRELKIDRSPNLDNYQEDIYVAIWSAFKLARTKLQEYSFSVTHRVSQSISPERSGLPVRSLRRSIGYAGG
jgi:hypothetical protein